MKTHASRLARGAVITCTLLLIFGVAATRARRMLAQHPAALNSSAAASPARRSGLHFSVSHVFDAHSPLRPAGCDDRCASKLRMQRFSAALQRRRSAEAQGRESSSTKKALGGGQRGGRGLADSIPWGQVNTRYFAGGAFAEYYVTLSLSSQSQAVLLLLDTGSDFTWVQCQPCEQCYTQKEAIFDPRNSPTAIMINQDDGYCAAVQAIGGLGQGADESLCLYQTGYADGTGSFGYIGREQYNFWEAGSGEGTGQTVSVSGVPYGCGTKNQDGGTGTESSGILGLGYGRGLSLPEQLSALQVYDSVFAMCLAPIFSNPNSGWLMFGDGAEAPDDSYSITPLLQEGFSVYYYVDVIDFVIDNTRVGIPDGVFDVNEDDTGGVIVDSGDVISLIAPSAYAPFRDAWLQAVSNTLGNPGASGPEGLDTCWDYPNDVALPSISFLFRDNNLFTLSVSATQLVYFDDNNARRMCWPFIQIQDGDSFAAMVIGAVSLHNTEVIFDAPNDAFAWKSNQC